MAPVTEDEAAAAAERIYERLAESGGLLQQHDHQLQRQLRLHFRRMPARYLVDMCGGKAEEVLIHLQLLADCADPANRPVVHARFLLSISSSSSSSSSSIVRVHVHEIVFVCLDKPKLLSQLSALVSEVGLNIREAHVYSTLDAFSLSVFLVDGWNKEEAGGLLKAIKEKVGRAAHCIIFVELGLDRQIEILMSQERAYWTRGMTKAFLDLCLREKAKMNMDGQYMSRLGWRNIKKDFATYAEEKLTAKQLQNKFTSLKKTFELWKKLKNETGAGYDSTTGMIINDAAWWKKMEGSFRDKPLQFEAELTQLFGDELVDDGQMMCPGDVDSSDSSRGIEDIPLGMSHETVRGSACHHRAGKEQVVDSPPKRKVKKTFAEYQLQRISDGVAQRSESSSLMKRRRSQEEVDNCLEILVADGLPRTSEPFLKAAELLRCPIRRATFQRMETAHERLVWIDWTWQNLVVVVFSKLQSVVAGRSLHHRHARRL
uniref:ACT domain-containing protein n=1 Tax=Oryza barthii TaxID=65489 RepID=A0A0D3GVH0_9ORYZ